MLKVSLLISLGLFSLSLSSQLRNPEDTLVQNTILRKKKVRGLQKPTNPTKAGLYSAIIPGLGQIYNKKYWKLPIVYGLLGTGAFIIVNNQNDYNRFRGAFLTRVNGGQDEFFNTLSIEALANTAEEAERDRNLAIVITGVFYLLNVFDAVVDAHLSVIDTDNDLSIAPTMLTSPNGHSRLGLGVNLRF